MALSGNSLLWFIPELHVQFDTSPLWQCYCPSCSRCDSVTVPPTSAVTVLLSLLLPLWQCYCPPAPAVTVLLPLLLPMWQCYCPSCSRCESVTAPPAPAVTVLLSLLLPMWQCYCPSCSHCDSVNAPPAPEVTVLLPLLFRPLLPLILKLLRLPWYDLAIVRLSVAFGGFGGSWWLALWLLPRGWYRPESRRSTPVIGSLVSDSTHKSFVCLIL